MGKCKLKNTDGCRYCGRWIYAAFAVLLLLSGCKKYSSECVLTIRPRVIQVQSSPVGGEPGYMIRVYAYYIPENEIKDWAPASYADADAGIIRNKKTEAIRAYDFMGEQEEDTNIYFTFSRSPVFLVAVDPINKFYAWRQFEYPISMARMEIVLRLQIWRPEVIYVETGITGWTIVNAKKQEEEQTGED